MLVIYQKVFVLILLALEQKLVQLEKTLDADFLGLEERIALCSSSRERALDRERGVDYASLPLRLSVSVSISHSNDVRDG